MLDQDSIDKLRLLLSTSGWNDVMRPVLENRIRKYIKLLVLHPSERGGEHQDDSSLRVRIQELEWMLASWQNELIVAQHNQQLDELERAQGNGTDLIGSGTPANP